MSGIERSERAGRRLAAVAALMAVGVAGGLARADGPGGTRPARTTVGMVAAARTSGAAERRAAARPATGPTPEAPPPAPEASAASTIVKAPPPAVETPPAAQRRLVAEAQDAAISVETAAMATQSDLRDARARKDATRAACLDDLLSQLHAASRTGRGLVDRIGAAGRRGDGAGIALERARLAVVAERAARLRAAAKECGAVESPGRTFVRVVRSEPSPHAAAF